MVTTKINAVEVCEKYLDKKQNFVLQGGAGSGKTESVKDLLLYLANKNSSARAICITHTNNAVHEIRERIGDKYPVSTIHAFLHDLIKKYKKNIHTIIYTLYTVPIMERLDFDENQDSKEYKKNEYERYKKIYTKYTGKLYSIRKEACDKVIGKRAYDIDPDNYNKELNQKIDTLNEYIKKSIQSCDYTKIRYNETKFDSFRDLSYGHDGLLTIAHLLFRKYPILGKIIIDKYDYIFIDEYQDTKQEVIHDLLVLASQKNETKKLTLCLFGDSMQAIYSDGIGNIDSYVGADSLILIPKADNYRCSYEVIEIINTLRLDGIQQEVALAKLATGEIQEVTDRHGDVKILYGICDTRPNAFSSLKDKEEFSSQIDYLIKAAKKDCEEAKILVLTNKAIAEKEGFKQLYKIFNDRYVEVSERMEHYLKQIQVFDICDICQLYETKKYNPLIKALKASGYTVITHQDKLKLKSEIKGFLSKSELSLFEAFNYAVDNKLIRITETCQNILDLNEKFIQDLSTNVKYNEFKKHYSDGQNTYSKIKNFIELESEEEFAEYDRIYKKELFINILFSKEIKFSEARNYYKYLGEESEYITMHKTKGSSIESVIVVMEEYFWNEYDFSTLYNRERANNKQERAENSQKLIYVASSRARKSLRCVRLLLQDEVEAFKDRFPMAEEIHLTPYGANNLIQVGEIVT
ncbi:ATP-dependent helicase [Listeria booriae]|uniref:UvrD-helicase domain-containing protein n=1 Tax=Listeria booriae TaxID=1552123 RepID=UPI00162A579C|nr:UvrD-helicase domain-containing protein [Listeria booriae]MBC2022888.1 ATP-dependent helicase [Listeria booriae]MBC2265429.1 ATP-dependent helicase [Listeria booriae]